MNTQQILMDKARSFEEKVKKEPMIKLTVREGAKLFGVSIQTMHTYYWKWKEMGIMKYVAKGKKSGDWYWIGVIK